MSFVLIWKLCKGNGKVRLLGPPESWLKTRERWKQMSKQMENKSQRGVPFLSWPRKGFGWRPLRVAWWEANPCAALLRIIPERI